jgi:hypothetical protein
MAYDYEKIKTPEPIRHDRNYDDFIANFRREWEDVIRDIQIIKDELKRLQDDKQDA